jgi:hypothetical protein
MYWLFSTLELLEHCFTPFIGWVLWESWFACVVFGLLTMSYRFSFYYLNISASSQWKAIASMCLIAGNRQVIKFIVSKCYTLQLFWASVEVLLEKLEISAQLAKCNINSWIEGGRRWIDREAKLTFCFPTA